MATAKVPSKDCFELIKEAEGLERKLSDGNIGAYLDPVGIPTIGFGSIFNIDKKKTCSNGRHYF
ncbi:lysozyme [Pseudanabaena biceps]|nr:lysozyme [Pseudanabaena biceps]